MTYSNYPSGFQNGVTIRGVPIDIPHPGEVFYVNNSTVLAKGGVGGSNGNPGTYQKPFSTIDYAVGKCTANRGDVIYVMPGHSETITAASAIDFDVAGIKVIGLGHGSKQAQIKSNHADATIVIDADDVQLINLRFTSTITGVAIGVSVLTLATDSVIKGCRFDVETTTTDEHVIAINYGVGCDRFLVEDCTFDEGLGGAATAIKLVGATAGGTIRNNRITGDYSLACISGITTLSTEIYIENNLLVNGGSANVGAVATISMVAASTGVVRGNTSFCNVGTGALHFVNTGMFHGDNWLGEDAGSANTASPAGGTFPAMVSITGFADD
jgi:hypothetical protein